MSAFLEFDSTLFYNPLYITAVLPLEVVGFYPVLIRKKPQDCAHGTVVERWI